LTNIQEGFGDSIGGHYSLHLHLAMEEKYRYIIMCPDDIEQILSALVLSIFYELKPRSTLIRINVLFLRGVKRLSGMAFSEIKNGYKPNDIYINLNKQIYSALTKMQGGKQTTKALAYTRLFIHVMWHELRHIDGIHGEFPSKEQIQAVIDNIYWEDNK